MANQRWVGFDGIGRIAQEFAAIEVDLFLCQLLLIGRRLVRVPLPVPEKDRRQKGRLALVRVVRGDEVGLERVVRRLVLQVSLGVAGGRRRIR